MPPKNPSADEARTDDKLDNDAEGALKQPAPKGPVLDEPKAAAAKQDDKPGSERSDPAEDQHEQTPADKLVAEVEGKANPVEAVETLVKNLILELQAEPGKLEELGDHLTTEARRLAEAALAGTNQGDATGTAGFGGPAPSDTLNPTEVANTGLEPANRAAVESAVAHGMEREDAEAMTALGSNS